VLNLSEATAKKLGYGTALGRTAYGLFLLFLPQPTLAVFGIKTEPGPLTWLGRVFGIRDVVLGAGTVAAIRRNDGTAGQWLMYSATADGADAALAIAKPDELGRARSYVAAAFSLSAARPGALAGRALGSRRA
jgi:hypothetical protein